MVRSRREEAGAAPDVDRVLRAIHDPTRRSILLSFYADAGPRTVDEVAARARIHRTAAFAHLEQLAQLGYLEVARRRGRLGKPAKLYSLASGEPIRLVHPARRFEELAALLATAVMGLDATARATVEFQGHNRGAEMARGARGEEEALAALAPLGADYRFDGDSVVAANCIFREVCPAARSVVCGMQAALITGALASAGVARRAEPRGPADGGRGCAYGLVPTGP